MFLQYDKMFLQYDIAILQNEKTNFKTVFWKPFTYSSRQDLGEPRLDPQQIKQTKQPNNQIHTFLRAMPKARPLQYP